MSVQGEEGNVYLTDDIILREMLKELKSSSVAVKRVHRNLEKHFGKVGDTISIEKPFKTKTAEGRTLSIQPMADQKISFKIDRQRNFGLQFTQRDRTLSIRNFSNRYLKSGVRQLGVDIEQSVLECAVRKTYNVSGVPGVAVDSDTFTDAAGYMTDVAVPEDGLRTGIVNTRDGKAIDKEMKRVYNPEMVKGAVRKGYLAPISDIEFYRSAVMPVHRVGDYGGSPQVDGAGQKGATLVTKGWTASKAELLRVGDSFTITGVYEIHPETRLSTGRLQTFVVTEIASSSAAGASSIKISPAINDGTVSTTNAAGETVSLGAYQNVSNAPANNAPITVIGTANLYYRQNVLFHRDAFTLCMVEKELPESAPVKGRITDEETGLSLSMTAQYDITEDMQVYRVDAVWGVDSLMPELSHRVYSAAL
ncbi:MAG: hypothetical protein K4305_08990 [Chlorobium sp.]|uniref:P22 phage major capsid protein family protein n=1 Tax=Chlorobium sp. TaxID=1095 RepID=UPI002F413B51